MRIPFKIEKLKINKDWKDLKINIQKETFIIVYNGKHSLDLNNNLETNVSKGVLYIPSGKKNKLLIKASDTSDVYVLSYHRDLFPHYFFFIYNYLETKKVLSFAESECFNSMINLCQMMDYEFKKEQTNSEIIRSLVQSFFAIYYGELQQIETIEHPSKNNFYISKLLDLIESNYRENHQLTFYSDKMMLSERQLNNLIKEQFDKNLSNLITQRKIIEAQRELVDTQKSISEIGFDLGYSEKSYFSRVFKKITSKTPREYQAGFLQM